MHDECLLWEKMNYNNLSAVIASKNSANFVDIKVTSQNPNNDT